MSAADHFRHLFASNSTDGDSLDYITEARYGTDPNLTDTDGDGVSDSDEVTNGTNPGTATTRLSLRWTFCRIFP